MSYLQGNEANGSETQFDFCPETLESDSETKGSRRQQRVRESMRYKGLVFIRFHGLNRQGSSQSTRLALFALIGHP
jgi:hypothetical protein